ncbi:MAG: AAA family ATPase [Evtepia gabavorous]
MGEWKHIITIGREYGAGGRSVAKRISDLLGIPHYDKEIIQLAAEKTGLSEEMIRGTEEHESGKPSSTGFSPAALPPPMTRQFWPRPKPFARSRSRGPASL